MKACLSFERKQFAYRIRQKEFRWASALCDICPNVKKLQLCFKKIECIYTSWLLEKKIDKSTIAYAFCLFYFNNILTAMGNKTGLVWILDQSCELFVSTWLSSLKSI